MPDSILQTLMRHASLESRKPYKKLTDQNLGTIQSFLMTRGRKTHGLSGWICKLSLFAQLVVFLGEKRKDAPLRNTRNTSVLISNPTQRT